MNQFNEHLKDISEIRSMMERSSKILSLSGLAGILIGIVALCGAMYAHYIYTRIPPEDIAAYLISDALLVLVIALGLSILLSGRMAKKKGLPLWNHTAKYLVIDLAIPLFAGGIFCVALIISKTYNLIPATMLAFYGLSLVNASKFTVREVRHLGLTQLTIGLLAAIFTQEGLIFWGIGFGITHIAYGTFMYRKYEQ